MAVRLKSVQRQSGGLRTIVISIAVCVAIIGIIIVTVPSLINLNRYKGLITSKIETAINKKVELKDIRLNLVGGVGLDVSGCAVSEPGGEAGADIFSCENLSIRLKILPLLSKRIEVAKIEIRVPHIHVVRDAHGNFNCMPKKAGSSSALQPSVAKKTIASAETRVKGQRTQKGVTDVKKKPAAQTKSSADKETGEQKMVLPAAPVAAKGNGAKPFAIGVESIQIVNGMISYRDETRKKPCEISFSDFALSMKGIEEGGDLKCKLSGTLNKTGKVKLQATVGKVPAGYNFGGAVDTLKGTLDVSLKGCDVTELTEIAREYVRDIPLLKGVFDADLSVKGSVRELAVNLAADLKRCEFAYQDVFAKAKDVPCSVQGKVQWKKTGDVTVDSFSLVFGNSKIQGSGHGSWASPLKLNMSAGCDLNFKDCAAIKQLKTYRPDGTMRLDLSVQTKGEGINLDALRHVDRTGLLKELRDVDFTVACVIKDFDTGIITRIQKGPVQYKGPVSADFEARGSVQDVRLNGKINLDESSIEYPVLFSKPAGKSLVSSFNINVKGLETVAVDTLDVKFGASKCKASGVINNIGTLDVDMKLASRVVMSDLSGIKDVKNYGFSGGLDAAIDIKGKVKGLRNMVVNGYIDIDHVKFKPPALNRGDVEIDGALKINKDLFDLQELLVVIGTSRLSVTGTVKNIDSPAGTFNVSMSRLDVDEILQLLSRDTASARLVNDKSQEGSRVQPARSDNDVKRAVPVNNGSVSKNGKKPVRVVQALQKMPVEETSDTAKTYLERIDVKGKFSVTELVYRKNSIRDIKTDIALKDGVLSLKDIALKGYGGSMQGAVTYRMSGATKEMDVAVRMQKVDINEILSANTSLKDRVLGRLDLDLQLSGRGATADIIKQRMSGKATVDIKEGKLVSVDILRNLSAISGIIGLDLPNIEDTDFRKLGMSLNIQDGICTTNDLEMLTDYFDMTGTGYFTFDMLLDMNLKVLLTKEFTTRLGSGDLQKALTGTDGRMSIPFTVKGQLDKPAFSPNWGDILKRQAQYRLQKMIGEKLFKEKTQEGESASSTQTGETTSAAGQETTSQKQSTKEILTDALINVFSESIDKEQQPAAK